MDWKALELVHFVCAAVKAELTLIKPNGVKFLMNGLLVRHGFVPIVHYCHYTSILHHNLHRSLEIAIIAKLCRQSQRCAFTNTSWRTKMVRCIIVCSNLTCLDRTCVLQILRPNQFSRFEWSDWGRFNLSSFIVSWPRL